jgi:hypothetical protein
VARLTVASVLRKSPDYDVDYVERLAAGVSSHLTVPHRFVCLSDVPVPVERIPLEFGLPGWWSKMELFRLPPPVLYFDLDTVIVGSLDGIADHARRSAFTALRDFYRPDGLGSGMMSWALDVSDLYRAFSESPIRWMDQYGARGDQAFIEDRFRKPDKWQDVVPGQVVSYKAHVRKATRRLETGTGDIPDNARVVCFHGKPRPREIGWQL